MRHFLTARDSEDLLRILRDEDAGSTSGLGYALLWKPRVEISGFSGVDIITPKTKSIRFDRSPLPE